MCEIIKATQAEFVPAWDNFSFSGYGNIYWFISAEVFDAFLPFSTLSHCAVQQVEACY